MYRDFKSVEEGLPHVEQWVPKLRQIALNEKVRLPAAADSPRLISGEQLGGRARYVFLVTPSWWPGAMRRAGDWPPGDLWT